MHPLTPGGSGNRLKRAMGTKPKILARSVRASCRVELAKALLVICRNIRKLQATDERRKACDDVARELRAMAVRFKHQKPD